MRSSLLQQPHRTGEAAVIGGEATLATVTGGEATTTGGNR